MSNENIKKAIVEATEKALDKVAENTLKNCITDRIWEISKFSNAQALVAWARTVVAEDNVSSEDQVQEFRDKCNEHYALLTK